MKNFNMNKIEGNDVDIEASLYEYGLAWITSNDEKEIIFWYGIGYNGEEFNVFDFCSFPSSLDVYSEFDFVEFERVYSFVGMDKKEWDELPLTSKISDLVSYYGPENIFGSTYTNGFSYNKNINRFIYNK